MVQLESLDNNFYLGSLGSTIDLFSEALPLISALIVMTQNTGN